MQSIEARLASELAVKPQQVIAAVALLDSGSTVPFIARYRKEATGSLDDQVLRELEVRLGYLRSLQKRREEVIGKLTELGVITDELAARVQSAETLAEIEDLYRPYRPKRKTRASVAKEKGLERLALWILEQTLASPHSEAEKYVDPEKGVENAEDALAGAGDIIAEMVSDDAAVRSDIRHFAQSAGVIETRAAGDDDAAGVYAMYAEFSEPARRIAPHRVLAIDRGEREGKLKIALRLDDAHGVKLAQKNYVKAANDCGRLVAAACEDSYGRLIFPAIEREIRGGLTDAAAKQAIGVFSLNLRQLLMQPPVRGCVTLAVDPAYRTGCKIAVVDETGKVLDTVVIYPTPPQNKVEEAEKAFKGLIAKYKVTVIAIGNGTASRESESFVAQVIKELPEKVSYIIVSEAGASVYSASKLAAAEFPQFDVSLRSAVSIARRLQDPLSELVKIDPKAIGVGQYQHDMPPRELDAALSGVVESCVNAVGVDLNTASQPLLSYVAGVNAAVAKNIVAFREENGAYTDRKQLGKVPKLGGKTFEQCAGFLRVPGAKNPLDATAVHPQSYKSAEKLLSMCGYTLKDLAQGRLDGLQDKVAEIGYPALCAATGEGEPTLRDIVSELLKPGRDPRDALPPPLLRSDVLELKHLQVGMELTGTVRNVIDFGAFVDIGVHEDGLVHISQISDRFIRHPSEAVKVGDVVKVRVLSVDLARKRIGLTMKLG